MCLHPWEVMDATPQRAIRQIVPGRFLCNPSECAAAMALQHMDDVARFRVQHAGDELRLFPTSIAGLTGRSLAFLPAIAIELGSGIDRRIEERLKWQWVR